jgi:hypothetical protein
VEVALGFRPHTGWTAAVAVAARDGAPLVLDRRRLELTTREVPVQAYHAAAGLSIEKATKLVLRAHEVARRAALAAMDELVGDLDAAGHVVVAVGVPIGQTMIPSDLSKILGSHPMLHAAEGDMFRQVLADAADDHGLRVAEIPARDLPTLAQRALSVDEARLRLLLTELGAAVGRPWRKDDKDATLVGWLALNGS